MGGGFPIDVAGAFERFVGADAVEIVAGAAAPGFDFSGQGVGESLEAGARFETGIDDDFVAQGDALAAFGETEREAGGELEGALAVAAAGGEAEVNGFFEP